MGRKKNMKKKMKMKMKMDKKKNLKKIRINTIINIKKYK